MKTRKIITLINLFAFFLSILWIRYLGITIFENVVLGEKVPNITKSAETFRSNQSRDTSISKDSNPTANPPDINYSTRSVT